MQPNISDFRENDRTRLAEGLACGRELCLRLQGQHRGPVNPVILDKVFKAWAGQPAGSRAANSELANGLGSLFGEILKNDFGFRWQLIEDEYGAEPALIDDNTGSVVFPVNAVWKRIEPDVDSQAFFQPMYEAIAAHLEKVNTGNGKV
ncbi:MAG: DUF3806 domain-containing protein [Candidatus Riflebacteria bacterium]|nr:DUF3806 domain-containing protein [Candidatus Riflebacteria bacterium]